MGLPTKFNQGSKTKTNTGDLQTIFNFFRRNSEFQKQRKEGLISYLNSKKKISNPDNKNNRVKIFVDFMKGKN